MNWADVVRTLHEGSDVVAGAPWHFATAVVVVSGIIVWICNRIHRFLYRDRLEMERNLKELYKERLESGVFIPPNSPDPEGGPLP